MPQGARAAFVESVDGGAQIPFELLLVKGVREHGQVDVLFQVDGTVFGCANVLAAERGNQARRPQQCSLLPIISWAAASPSTMGSSDSADRSS